MTTTKVVKMSFYSMRLVFLYSCEISSHSHFGKLVRHKPIQQMDTTACVITALESDKSDNRNMHYGHTWYKLGQCGIKDWHPLYLHREKKKQNRYTLGQNKK